MTKYFVLLLSFLIVSGSVSATTLICTDPQRPQHAFPVEFNESKVIEPLNYESYVGSSQIVFKKMSGDSVVVNYINRTNGFMTIEIDGKILAYAVCERATSRNKF